MGKVLQFNKKPVKDAKTDLLIQLSDEFDAVIVDAVFDQEIDPKDVAGLLAHRLGALIRQLEGPDREKLIRICQEITQKQANRSSGVNKGS